MVHLGGPDARAKGDEACRHKIDPRSSPDVLSHDDDYDDDGDDGDDGDDDDDVGDDGDDGDVDDDDDDDDADDDDDDDDNDDNDDVCMYVCMYVCVLSKIRRCVFRTHRVFPVCPALRVRKP